MTYNNPTTGTNISPYYDDFDDTKGFLRLLFRPGRAVQGRELTQLQTLLQDQIGKFGNHIFEEKTVIMGGDIGVSPNTYVRTTPIEGFDPTVFLGTNIYATSGTDNEYLITDTTSVDYKKARITSVIPATTDDPYDIFFTNQMSGSTFGVGDTFRAWQSNTSADSTNITIPSALSSEETDITGYSLTGSGNVVTVDEGIFYVDKFFVKTGKQNYIPYDTHELVNSDDTTRTLRLYETNPTKSIGFEIGHNVIDYTSDSSLLDGSEGTSNFTAPGADRYKMSLTLGQRDYTTYGTGDSVEVDNSLVSEENYFELIRLHNGNIQNKLIRTGYSGIDDYLAQRTYDESGNYIVSGFNLEMREHLRNMDDDDHKDGMFTTDQGGETGKFALKLGRGKAYVEGFEYNTLGETLISADKTRGSIDTGTVSGENVITNLGLHVKVTNSAGGITLGTTTTDFDNMGEVYFVGPTGLSLDGTTAGAVGNSGGVIGKGRIQTLISSGTDYSSVFLADIEMGVCGGVRYPFYLTNTIHGASANTRIDGFVHDNVAGDKYMTISPTHGKDATDTYKTIGFESRFTGNVFHVENSGLKTVTGLDYTARVCVDTTVNQASIGAISTSDINNSIVPSNDRVQFPLTSGSEAISVSSIQVYGIISGHGEFLVPVAAADDVSTNGVYFYDNTDDNGVGRSKLNFKVGSDFTNKAVKIFANVVINDSSSDSHIIRRTKTKVEGASATVTMGAANANGLVEGKIPYSDVYKINGISGGNDADITTKFFVDLGNKPSYYDHATLVAMNSAGLTQGAQVTVNFDYYVHSSGNDSGGWFGPFTADSYPDYDTIPAVWTKSLGRVSLRDCLDFRPVRENVADSTNFNTVFVPYHSTSDDLNAIEIDYQHYMGRIDFLYLRNDKVLKLVQGTPAAHRRPPSDIVDGMLIATIDIPPYVYHINDIRVNLEDNKRYTMRDIGKIKSKVDRMEYYTALSLMEQSAENTMMVDANGLPRFKNGILVDPFAGHNIGDATNPDYNILIDDTMNAAYCPQVNDNIDLEQHGSIEGLQLTDDDCYVLKSSRVHLIDQTVRSAKISVNPYNVVSFTGDIKLRPETDTWTDTTRLPAQNLSQNIDATVQGLSSITDQLGAVIAGTNLVASDVVTGANAAANAARAARAATVGRNWWRRNGWRGQTWREEFGARSNFLNNLNLPNSSTRVQERRTSRRIMDSTTQIRTERFQATESTTNSTMNMGDRVVETSNIPFMRAKNIRITSTGLRPNTRIYPFFDGQAVTEYCTPATYGNSRDSITTTGDLGGALTTDENGKIGLHFDIPAGDFRTGGRQFKLTDHEGNSAQLESTFADAEYTATGLLQVVQSTSVTTSVRRSRVQRTAAGWEDVGATRRRWVDPIAQSIMISADEYPNGVFAKSVDLFFAQKDDSLPVSVEIRPVVNGYPSSGEHIPMSKVVLDPEDCVAATDWTNSVEEKTRFEFSTPVYLTPGEYCIVVISNSDKYEVWYSTMGEYKLNDDGTLGSTKISSQPYTGSFFKSQNASTWTADQNSDLCFRFSICDFTSSGLEGSLDLSAVMASKSDVGTNHFHSIEGVNGDNTFRYQRYHELMPSFTQMAPGDTSISHTTLVQTESQFGNNGHQTISTQVDSISLMDERKSVILSEGSGHGQGSGDDTKSLIHKIKFTGTQFLTPVIDAERMCLDVTEYLINNNKNLGVVYDQQLINGVTANAGVSASASGNYNGEYEPNSWGDNAPLVRYITTPVILEEGINALGLSVFLTQDIPVGTDIHVFARTLEEQAETSIRREKWVRILPDSVAPKGTGFREIEYKLAQESEFGQFQVKFVMYQTKDGLGNQYPIVKDLRAIAVT